MRNAVLACIAGTVAGLLIPTPVVAAATPLLPADRGPGGQALYVWEVNQSWPGEDQYDARLDTPVQLWVAGTPAGM